MFTKCFWRIGFNQTVPYSGPKLLSHLLVLCVSTKTSTPAMKSCSLQNEDQQILIFWVPHFEPASHLVCFIQVRTTEQITFNTEVKRASKTSSVTLVFLNFSYLTANTDQLTAQGGIQSLFSSEFVDRLNICRCFHVTSSRL